MRTLDVLLTDIAFCAKSSMELMCYKPSQPEKSFARREGQREFLKFQPDLKLISSERTRMTWARDKEKVTII